MQLVLVASVGCASFGEVLSVADAACADLGGCLCAAVRTGSLSMAGLLLDLQDLTGYTNSGRKSHAYECRPANSIKSLQL